jgi:cardiolipin synthase
MLIPTVGQRATAGVLRRAFLLPRSRSFFFSLHTSYRSQHTQSPQRKPSLRENIYTFPNLLTVSRIAACPVLGWSILSDNYSAATCLLLYAGITDWVSV